MPSECARASTAAESSYRIAAPNAQARAVKVVALDRSADTIMADLAARGWANASFLTAPASGPAPGRDEYLAAPGWLRDITGQVRDLIGELADADLVVMITTAGQDAPAAAVIGELCRLKGVMTTALVAAGEDVSRENMARTLAQLRPYSMMLVSTSSTDYFGDMLTALRA